MQRRGGVLTFEILRTLKIIHSLITNNCECVKHCSGPREAKAGGKGNEREINEIMVPISLG